VVFKFLEAGGGLRDIDFEEVLPADALPDRAAGAIDLEQLYSHGTSVMQEASASTAQKKALVLWCIRAGTKC